MLPSITKKKRQGSSSCNLTDSHFEAYVFTHIKSNYIMIVWTWNICSLEFWTSSSLTDVRVTLKQLEELALVTLALAWVCIRALVKVKLKRKVPLISSVVGQIVIKGWCCFFFLFLSGFTVFLPHSLLFGPWLTGPEPATPTGWEQIAPYTHQWCGNLPSPLCATTLASWFDDTSYSQHNASTCLS